MTSMLWPKHAFAQLHTKYLSESIRINNLCLSLHQLSIVVFTFQFYLNKKKLYYVMNDFNNIIYNMYKIKYTIQVSYCIILTLPNRNCVI